MFSARIQVTQARIKTHNRDGTEREVRTCKFCKEPLISGELRVNLGGQRKDGGFFGNPYHWNCALPALKELYEKGADNFKERKASGDYKPGRKAYAITDEQRKARGRHARYLLRDKEELVLAYTRFKHEGIRNSWKRIIRRLLEYRDASLFGEPIPPFKVGEVITQLLYQNDPRLAEAIASYGEEGHGPEVWIQEVIAYYGFMTLEPMPVKNIPYEPPVVEGTERVWEEMTEEEREEVWAEEEEHVG